MQIKYLALLPLLGFSLAAPAKHSPQDTASYLEAVQKAIDSTLILGGLVDEAAKSLNSTLLANETRSAVEEIEPLEKRSITTLKFSPQTYNLEQTVMEKVANETLATVGGGSVEKRDEDKWGRATVFEQKGSAGSCGNYNPDSAWVVALSSGGWMHEQYQSPHCGRRIKATNVGSDSGAGGQGTTIIATVADTCPASECGYGDIDFSVGAWNALTNNSPWGTAKIQWHFCDGDC